MTNLINNAFAISLFKKLRKEQNQKIDESLKFAVELSEEIKTIKGEKGDQGKAGIKI